MILGAQYLGIEKNARFWLEGNISKSCGKILRLFKVVRIPRLPQDFPDFSRTRHPTLESSLLQFATNTFPLAPALSLPTTMQSLPGSLGTLRVLRGNAPGGPRGWHRGAGREGGGARAQVQIDEAADRGKRPDNFTEKQSVSARRVFGSLFLNLSAVLDAFSDSFFSAPFRARAGAAR